MLMMSLIELNKSKEISADKKALIKSSNQRLFKAYQLEPRNSLSCIEMASRFFEKDLHKANIMATSSLLHTKDLTLKAEALTIKGRIAHVKVK